MDNTNSLLRELDNLHITTPTKHDVETVQFDHDFKDTDTESDEFDEIMNRQSVKKLEHGYLGDRREIPGSSPRLSAHSPFLSEDDEWDGSGCPPGNKAMDKQTGRFINLFYFYQP